MNKKLILVCLGLFLATTNLSSMNEDAKALLKAKLFSAIRCQNRNEIKHLLDTFDQEKIDWDTKNCCGYTPLHEFFRCAAEEDFQKKVIQKFPCHKNKVVQVKEHDSIRWSIANLLISRGANLQTEANDKVTLMQTARQCYEVEFDLTMYNNDPEKFASSINLSNYFFAYLAHQKNSSIKINSQKNEDIFEAIQVQNIGAVREYLENNGYTNLKNPEGYTLLHYFFACKSECDKKWPIARLLLQHHALINSEANDGTTLLKSALQHKEILSDLDAFRKATTECVTVTGLPCYFFFALDLKTQHK